MKAYTDYPTIARSGGLKEVEVVSYDRDKYCIVAFDGWETEIKSGYIYTDTKYTKITREELSLLPLSTSG